MSSHISSQRCLILTARLRERAISILEQAVANRVFPGASFAVTRGSEILTTSSAGRFTYEADSPEVLPETAFDLASVTKVVATTSMAMILYDRGKLDLNANVIDRVPEFHNKGRDSRRRQITFRMLLAHSSGLPGYARLFEKAQTSEALLQAIYEMPLEADPDTRAEYSDIGFILLGEALSRIAGEPLDEFCQREIFNPLQMTITRYLPPEDWKSRIPPTVNDQQFRHRAIQGEVNDENASVLGGVSAHAGVFSNVEDVSKFALCILGYGPQLFRRETVQLFVTRQNLPPGARVLSGGIHRPPFRNRGNISLKAPAGTWATPEPLCGLIYSGRSRLLCSATAHGRTRPIKTSSNSGPNSTMRSWKNC